MVGRTVHSGIGARPLALDRTICRLNLGTVIGRKRIRLRHSREVSELVPELLLFRSERMPLLHLRGESGQVRLLAVRFSFRFGDDLSHRSSCRILRDDILDRISHYESSGWPHSSVFLLVHERFRNESDLRRESSLLVFVVRVFDALPSGHAVVLFGSLLALHFHDEVAYRVLRVDVSFGCLRYRREHWRFLLVGQSLQCFRDVSLLNVDVLSHGCYCVRNLHSGLGSELHGAGDVASELRDRVVLDSLDGGIGHRESGLSGTCGRGVRLTLRDVVLHPEKFVGPCRFCSLRCCVFSFDLVEFCRLLPELVTRSLVALRYHIGSFLSCLALDCGVRVRSFLCGTFHRFSGVKNLLRVRIGSGGTS